MRLFDTHAHYEDERFSSDRYALIASLPEAGVEYVANVGCNVDGSRFAIGLAEKFNHVYAVIGIHPHDADEFSEEAIGEIEKLSRHEKVVAIGEIGLDYHYNFSPRDVQKNAFRCQMELAEKLNLPVCIHNREAHEDCMNIIREYPNVTGVFHCYSGSLETAREIVKLGYMISFTGVITFKNAKKFGPIIASLPEDRIMIETDCPYLAPEPFRGKRNSSLYVYRVAEEIGRIRNIAPEEAAKLTTENALRFYRIKG
ncbi:MAG: TatD family hydrolase [Clostridiales bacterium]|nr:TatD family hydrolase [Clostridiales bacterium]